MEYTSVLSHMTSWKRFGSRSVKLIVKAFGSRVLRGCSSGSSARDSHISLPIAGLTTIRDSWGTAQLASEGGRGGQNQSWQLPRSVFKKWQLGICFFVSVLLIFEGYISIYEALSSILVCIWKLKYACVHTWKWKLKFLS
jgi:hypothetical protein